MAAIPADAYAPFNGQAAYEDTWREIFGSWLADGVMAGVDNELLVYGDSTGRQVKVKTGRARIFGQHGRWTSEKTLTLAANTSGQPRIDRIVARARLTGSPLLLADVEIDVLQGTPGATPAAPALTRNASVVEIPLAQVRCANGFTTVPAQSTFPTARVPGAPVDERGLLSAYGMPTFADVAARDLWVPSPQIGFEAGDREKGGRWFYDGTAWLQTLRQRFTCTDDGGGADTVVGPGATWPANLHTTITVPKWATRARAFAKIGQALAISGVANVDLELQLGAITIDTDRIRWDNTVVNGNNEHDITLSRDVDCSAIAGTSVVFRTFGNNVSGSGALRVGSESSSYAEIEFR